MLIVDQNIRCYTDGTLTGEYILILATSVTLVTAFSIGMPALLLYKMWKVRSKIHEKDEETLKLYGFIIGEYRDAMWYWEMVELGRKLVLAGLIGLLGRGQVSQTVGASFVAFFFFALHIRAQPYERPVLNAVSRLSPRAARNRCSELRSES